MNELGAKRVLVIDDDALSREVLELLLAGEGYGVELAGSGQEALDWLREPGTRPDVVLMDLQMPGVCGEELVRRLRAACGELRVIAMSGSVPEDGTPAGADGFLLKPFSMEDLGEAVRPLQLGGAAREEGSPLQLGHPALTPLDDAVFGVFRGMLGTDALGELYASGVRDAAAQWERMRGAAEAGDYDALRKFAHATKGSLGMLGARELERMCLDLEAGVVNDTYVTTLERFPSAIGRLRDMLDALGVSIRSNSQK